MLEICDEISVFVSFFSCRQIERYHNSNQQGRRSRKEAKQVIFVKIHPVLIGVSICYGLFIVECNLERLVCSD